MDPATEFTTAMRKTAASVRRYPLQDAHIWNGPPETRPVEALLFWRGHPVTSERTAEPEASANPPLPSVRSATKEP